MMISDIAGLNPAASSQLIAATAGRPNSTKVQTEFMTIFYKELLKQVFTTPKFGVDEEEGGFGSSLTAMNSDLMAEKMAEYMVKNALASNQWAVATPEAATP
jgi:Rod binding domain-containing protein